MVGALADALEADAEFAGYLEAQLEAVNRCLRAAALPPHQEPRVLSAEQRWGADMFGYSGLHYLRRVAAYLDSGLPLPPPGDEGASEDPVMERYYAAVERPAGTLRAWLRREPRPARGFDHLMLHSDAEGYYVPLDFRDVLFADDALGVAGSMIGSAPALLRECDRLAESLGVPPSLDADDEALWEAADAQGRGEGWARYGIEAFSCVRLREAARRSIAAGAAIVFC